MDAHYTAEIVAVGYVLQYMVYNFSGQLLQSLTTLIVRIISLNI